MNDQGAGLAHGIEDRMTDGTVDPAALRATALADRTITDADGRELLVLRADGIGVAYVSGRRLLDAYAALLSERDALVAENARLDADAQRMYELATDIAPATADEVARQKKARVQIYVEERSARRKAEAERDALAGRVRELLDSVEGRCPPDSSDSVSVEVIHIRRLTAALADPTPPAPVNCRTSPVSSRVCERGTKMCVVKHEPPAPEGE